jgi:hypothetical protein
MGIKYNNNKNSIKVWPYLDDISQAIIPYSDEHLSKSRDMVVNLDFSCVKRANSSGSAITLAKLIYLLTGKRGYLYKLVMPEDSSIEEYLQKSGFFALINDKFYLEQANLFEPNYIRGLLKLSILRFKIGTEPKSTYPCHKIKKNLQYNFHFQHFQA